MTELEDAVWRQISYVVSVRRVIRRIWERIQDGEWASRIFASSDARFKKQIDDALLSLDFATVTENDSRKVMVNILCGEVSDFCRALKVVCEASGYGEYYESYISHDRFIRLAFGGEEEKIGRMQKIVNDRRLTPIDVLRGVGAILNDEPLEERAALDARERRRANAEIKALAADVKTTMQLGFDRTEQKMLECRDEIKSDIAAVDKKVSRLKCRGKRRGKYDDETTEFCVALLSAAEHNETIKSGLTTRVTHSAVFDYNKRELNRRGVVDVETFKKIIRAYQAKMQRHRAKEHEERQKQDAAQTSGKQTGRKNGIIRVKR